MRRLRNPWRLAAFVAVGLLALAVPLGAIATSPLQPTGKEAVPPVMPDAGATAPQPDGTGRVPPVTKEKPLAQPRNADPDPEGAPTQVQGPKERAKGVNGADRAGGRKDAGGVRGNDAGGGRSD